MAQMSLGALKLANKKDLLEYNSWGLYPYARQKGIDLSSTSAVLPQLINILPQGNSKSYGDSCLNPDGIVISSKRVNKILSIDQKDGILSCEPGVTLRQIRDLVEPLRWALPVVPGTSLITVGGAVGNDVHGKNHYKNGTFGRHVIELELVKTSGERITCSRNQNTHLFCATIGGLGLTGFIVKIVIQLEPLTAERIYYEQIKCPSLSSMLSLFDSSVKDYEYSMAWLDASRSNKNIGRGVFTRANRTPISCHGNLQSSPFSLNYVPPISLVNEPSIRVFNALYRSLKPDKRYAITSQDNFFFPLDSVHHWNRLYGRKGFVQYQFVIPREQSHVALTKIFREAKKYRASSSLCVMKVFGDLDSPGVLSFPREGISVAMDFPLRGEPTMNMLESFDAIVAKHNGAIYPAKDAHIGGSRFKEFFPMYRKFLPYVDDGISSGFWNRVKREL